eukprot:GFYU01017606.1.p1 GENE.GFYU01017606.1~~GFYU01017606.1.p1  ORF type:complete len:239 (+),score=18.06 GFYU01017606.1:68-784(+)
MTSYHRSGPWGSTHEALCPCPVLQPRSPRSPSRGHTTCLQLCIISLLMLYTSVTTVNAVAVDSHSPQSLTLSHVKEGREILGDAPASVSMMALSASVGLRAGATMTATSTSKVNTQAKTSLCSHLSICRDLIGQYFYCYTYHPGNKVYMREKCLRDMACNNLAEHLKDDLTCEKECIDSVKQTVMDAVRQPADKSKDFPDCNRVYYNEASVVGQIEDEDDDHIKPPTPSGYVPEVKQK